MTKKNSAVTLYWPSPAGRLGLTVEDQALTRVFFDSPSRQNHPDGRAEKPGEIFQRAFRQLEEYFAGRRRNFQLPLAPAGTAFQRQVWSALENIPYGQTMSYGALAARAGSPRAFRAAGQACRRNPLAIVIPCHRAVGWDGRLTGFAGGLAIKEFLLRLEAGVKAR